jgi:small subunit ribosomal protein S7e
MSSVDLNKYIIKVRSLLSRSLIPTKNNTSRDPISQKKGVEADDFEILVAQELFNLSSSGSNEISVQLRKLFITAAKQIEVPGGRKAVIIFVPFRFLKAFQKIQERLVAELEVRLSVL